MKEIIYKTKLFSHRLTNHFRALPNFLIIGVPRGGTTSLFNYLIQHPLINPPLWKEIDFFATNYDKGIQWYKSFFPLRKKGYLTGEASPIYLYHPLAPKRIHEIIPNVKLIVLLRNPVDRANSHYWQSIRKHRESLSFQEAINKQLDQTQVYKESIDTNNMKTYFDTGNSYIAGGLYLEGIKNYLKIFPKNQFLILRSEDLYDNAQTVLNTITDFLEIERWSLKKAIKYNYHEDQTKMDESIRKKLLEYYKPHNERLYKYLNVNFGWDA